MKQRIQFKIKVNEDGSYHDFMPGLTELMTDLQPGDYYVILDMIPTNLAKAKAKYFALVTELAEHAGYMSKSEKDLFKQQIKEQLGNESIREMTDMMQVSIKIEELYRLAAEHYGYQFMPYDPGT